MSTTQVLTPAPATSSTPATAPLQANPQPAPPSPGILHIQTQPAVDQDGAFLQDKVLKSGWLLKRTRKTKVPTPVDPPSSHVLG